MIMSQIKVLENKNIVGISNMSYECASKKQFLKDKKRIIKEVTDISKKSILGFGYTAIEDYMYDDFEKHSINITEYIFINNPSKIGEIYLKPLSEIIFVCDNYSKSAEKYMNNLDELGYIRLSDEFMEKTSDEIIEKLLIKREK